MYSEIRSAGKTWVYKHTPPYARLREHQAAIGVRVGLERKFVPQGTTLSFDLILHIRKKKDQTDRELYIVAALGSPPRAFHEETLYIPRQDCSKEEGLPRQFSKLSLKHAYSLNSKHPLL